MAVGQLFDYRRFESGHIRLAVLLPVRPSDDGLTYLRPVDVRAWWLGVDEFVSDDMPYEEDAGP